MSALGGSRRARPHPQPERHVLEHRHVTEQGVVLEDESDTPVARAAGGRVLAGQQHRSGIAVVQAGDNPQQRRLARAGRPEQRHELAGGDLQADVVQRDEAAEALRYAADFDTHSLDSTGPSGLSVIAARRSTTVLTISVTSASNARSEATAKAAWKLYSL